MDNNNEIYGPHLMLRIGGIEKNDAGSDPEKLSAFLVDLVHALGMRVLAGPCIGYEPGDAAHFGHSAVVILYESHAAVHTYPQMRQLFLDVFSCKSFRAETVYEVIERWFGGFEILEYNLLDRGVHWQHDAQAALAQWRARRTAIPPVECADK